MDAEECLKAGTINLQKEVGLELVSLDIAQEAVRLARHAKHETKSSCLRCKVKPPTRKVYRWCKHCVEIMTKQTVKEYSSLLRKKLRTLHLRDDFQTCSCSNDIFEKQIDAIEKQLSVKPQSDNGVEKNE